MITKYHANYYADVLMQHAVGGEIESLSQSLLNAAVDINPHQIEAALFAFRSPLSKGVILADEVGLGKTIEAGLVLCQYWATGRRKIIVICPAALRKQWGFELSEKFGIDSEIIDAKSYNEYIRNGKSPFGQEKVIICSYNFAARKKEEIRLFGFNLAGQKSDVVIVNFVNEHNFADKRVFTLLDEKFKLLNDVFGASDEVLGQIDGVDFEKRIWLIYQECRTESEISEAFEKLQNELQNEISSRIDEVKDKIQKTFDIDVQERLKLAKEHTSAFLNRYEYIFWELTKYVLAEKAVFDDSEHSFVLKENIAENPKGKYHFISGKATDGILYRLSHPLAKYVIDTAGKADLSLGRIRFSPKDTALNIILPEELNGKSGYLFLSALDVSAYETERYSLFTAYTSDGQTLFQEVCEKLFLCAGTEIEPSGLTALQKKLSDSVKQHFLGKLQQIVSRNLAYFKEKEERIFRWERDLITSLENELDTVKRQIREQERLVRNAMTVEEKIAAAKKLDELERSKRRKRNELADREDDITNKRRQLIADLDARLIKQTDHTGIFIVEWQIGD